MTKQENKYGIKINDTITLTNKYNCVFTYVVTGMTDKSIYLYGARNSWNNLNTLLETLAGTINGKSIKN